MSRRRSILTLSIWLLGASARAQSAGEAGTPQAPPEPAPVEVVVRGGKSEAKQLQTSSQAVTVVTLERAQKRSADLGEVLSRIQGVNIRRNGSLGADFKLSLNGLTDAQIRVYVDGVPLELTYAQGLANLPVNLFERVDVYRGVVPIGLGADALGGALEMHRPGRYETGARASYQLGSFGLHRASGGARYRHGRTGFVAGVEAFVDKADNDYRVDVDVADSSGQLSRRSVRRFHDGYLGYGVTGELGFTDRKWARKLLVRGFGSGYDKELQHNVIMTVPYGAASYGERLRGALLQYENTFFERLDLSLLGSYAFRSADFEDTTRWVYDWYGQRARERVRPGEVDATPSSRRTWQHGEFVRATADLRLSTAHVLSVNATVSHTQRSGDDRLQPDPALDALRLTRRLTTLVTALAYAVRALPMREGAALQPEDYRVENTLFGESYLYRTSIDALDGARIPGASASRFGVGDALRIYATEWLLAKASYELTTHLPNAEQAFGNGGLISANLELQPEVSHNGNLGPALTFKAAKLGRLWIDINGFLRDTDKQLILSGTDRSFSYQNLVHGRSLGIEGSLLWAVPRRLGTINGSFTYQDLRNRSRGGPYGEFYGDRLPNRPWLFAAWGADAHFADVLLRNDAIDPFYLARYVRSFHRSWESIGAGGPKQTVAAQLSHSLGVSYSVRTPQAWFALTLEVQNVTDANLYDSFGVQRPGRAYYAKLLAEL